MNSQNRKFLLYGVLALALSSYATICSAEKLSSVTEVLNTFRQDNAIFELKPLVQLSNELTSSSGLGRARKLVQIGELLIKADEIDRAEPFFREAWLLAQTTVGQRNIQTEPFAERYAQYLWCDRYLSSNLSSARSAERQAARSTIPSDKESRLKEAATYRKAASDQKDQILKGLPMWHSLSIGFNACGDEERKFRFQTLALGHYLRTEPDYPLRVGIYHDLAKMYVARKEKRDAINAYNNALTDALRAWRADSDEVTSLIDECYSNFPEQAATIANLGSTSMRSYCEHQEIPQLLMN